MKTQQINNVKLGLFVVGGAVFLVLMLYMIGKNQHLWGNTYVLKARFENVQGLMPGNNVRYAGNEAGTVKKIELMNDTVIEVSMVVEEKMKKIIKKNAFVSIGTEGLVGNKVVNILPSKMSAPLAEEGDVLKAKKTVNTDDMLQTLSNTNQDIAKVVAGLKITVNKLNESEVLWETLKDPQVSDDIKSALRHLNLSTQKAAHLLATFDLVLNDIQNGKGSIGKLIKDSSHAESLSTALFQFEKLGAHADSMVIDLHDRLSKLDQEIKYGNGSIQAILKDSVMSNRIRFTIDHIEKGTDGFQQNMEALKHNILFRGYFRKLEKRQKK